METLAETGGPDAAKKLLPFGWHSESAMGQKADVNGPIEIVR